MTATTISIDKTLATIFAEGLPDDDQAVMMVKVGRKVPAIGETIQLKGGKTILVGAVVATAKVTFTPIIVRRVLDLKTGGEVGERLGRLVGAAEQGASQAGEHLAKLSLLAGYDNLSKTFDAAQKTPDKDDQPLELTRQLVAIANLKALA